ncbi:hypothetical protein MPPM_0625 [Methylorubrum populi]|uniref:Uncharacterized protein n=1 Tax=Methylorubrum populi TaxID=223967 RepID=A0A160PDE4_9HYPH|nr:hypothetical protein MPPM_0625 [Methylorubrum populi]
MKRVDGGGGAIDGNADSVETLGKPGEQIVGLGQAGAFAEQPIADANAGLKGSERDVLGFRSVGKSRRRWSRGVGVAHRGKVGPRIAKARLRAGHAMRRTP